MVQSIRAQFGKTVVQTVSGKRLGWFADIEIDVDTASVCAICVQPNRFIAARPLWIQRNDIVRWEVDRITVKDAWRMAVSRQAVPAKSSALPLASCSYDERG